MSRELLADAQPIPDFGIAGLAGWTTTRQMGSFGMGDSEPVHQVMHRWSALQDALAVRSCIRLASATQVHGADISIHGDGWTGWLRQRGIDGHATNVRGTALAVTVADCTPVFIAHPQGVIALLHAGWRGTAANILNAGLSIMASFGCPAEECRMHLGPSICGQCYEVGPEVLEAVTGKPASAKGLLDVRAVLSDQARACGVHHIDTSAWCTRCHGHQFFSHRGGDAGRQLGVLALM